MQTDAFVQWRKMVGVDSVAWKESGEEVAALTATLFQELGYLSALDYSKAYDHMYPNTTEKVLNEAGVPERLTKLMIALRTTGSTTVGALSSSGTASLNHPGIPSY